jgi:hypothetical protein
MAFDPNEKRDSHGRWSRLAGLLDTTGGFTHSLGRDTERSKGYAVAISGHEETFKGKATANDIKHYVARHLKALGHPQAHLGAWFNSQDGKSYLDISHVRTNFAAALAQARKDKQIALYDLGTGNEYHTMSEDWQPNLDAMKGTDLTGLPSKPTPTPGHGSYVFHSNKDLQKVANDYIAEHGRSPEPTDYSTVDAAKAAKVAKAFEEMKHDPNDPEVKKAYDALKREVAAQYEALTKAGYSYHFYPKGGDPYANTPREAVYDLTHNHKMFVFPTIGEDGGFGEDAAKYPGHPLLEKVPGVQWDGQDVTYNDMFRGVHDSMAHSKEGVGFGPRGEDNAYRQHFATFSPDAQKALASETRGQNTWVNFGPHGEHNRADPRHTIYAPQKAGILPPWAIDPEFLKKESQSMSLSTLTPVLHGEYDLSARDGKLAFWKQILPKKTIHYTAKDGSRQTLDFNEQYLRDLASSTAVDKVGFLLADKDNAHTMDPERWRGEVAAMEVRDDGLYGKIVFPSVEAARAVLDNPSLGVSARIRENIGRSDGSTVSRGIIHVLGTLDPQVSGMTPWQPTDLSASQDEVLDLSEQEYADMSDKTKALADYTEADIDAMDEATLDAFLAEFVPGFDATLVDETDEHEDEDAEKGELVGAGADMSNGTATTDLDLANARADQATAFANEALRRVADAEWREERTGYLSDGVPPAALDLAAPVLNRASDMVIDLSNSGEDDVNVSAVVRGLLDSLKGTVDLSTESGHFGTHSGEDNPDQAILDRWTIQG